MIKKLGVLLILFSVLLVSCGKKEEIAKTDDTIVFESELEGNYLLTEGNGWASRIEVSPDGSFSGEYHNSDMDKGGLEFDGTVYSSNFTGKFSKATKVDDFTYTMKVESLDTIATVGEEYIEDSIKHINSEPFGIKKGSEVTVFLQDKNLSDVDSKFISWIKNGYYFEGDIMPVTGMMIVVDDACYGWIQEMD